MAERKRRRVKATLDQKRDNNLPHLTDTEVSECVKGLGLEGKHYLDFWIAQYHVNYPDLIGNTNYKTYIAQRAYDIERDLKTSVEEPKPKKDTITFRDRCDLILCGMENGDFSELGNLSSRQINTIKDIILHGTSGRDEYWNSPEDFRRSEPELYDVWEKLSAVTKPKVARARRKTSRDVAKLVDRLGIGSDIDGLTPGIPPERLFDDGFSTFVFYNTKYNRVMVIECGSVDKRWVSAKTLSGSVKRFSFKRADIPRIVSSRSSSGVIKLCSKKMYADDKMRITKDMVLVKAFKERG